MTDVPLPFPPEPSRTAPVSDPRGLAAPVLRLDGTDARRLVDPPPSLAPFIDLGVLGAADVHVAAALTRLGGDDRPEVLLAAALAVRAPRRRHVCVDLTTVRLGVVAELTELADADDADAAVASDRIAGLPWPEPDAWLAVLADSPLVEVRDPEDLREPDDAGRDVRPLTLAGPRLYLDRYWRYERRVAAALDARARAESEISDPGAAAASIDAAFDGAPPDRQRVATALALTRRLTILAGGPGTGKTTTIARVISILVADARRAGRPVPHIALAAPTGKAAARLTESLRQASSAATDGDPDADLLRELTATTLHRLLGPRGRTSRFRHDRTHPLPHDVIVVDETSMVPLALLAKLLDAVRLDARLILVGDPHQLASVEAGSVLGDLVGDPDASPVRSQQLLGMLSTIAGDAHTTDTSPATDAGVHDALVVLDRVHRFRAGSGLDRFAAAVRTGDADGALHKLATATDLTWITGEQGGPTDDELTPVRDRLRVAGGVVLAAALADGADDAAAALTGLETVRILCAHRRGSVGVQGWTERCEAWLREDVALDTRSRWYVGRPVLVTTNDRRLQLWNGDLGVVVRHEDGVAIAFPALDGDGVRYLAPARVGEVETVHAMTVHKSQGSQVGHAVVVLPDPASRICTRELLYTAVTRAREGATIVASEASLRATIAARTQRASGLGVALGRS
ncbi:MAG: exodeoxyribonuclease V subunit alpha [Nitriliruptor sp.]|uniref:exodeoxyribonuclease V subunit alpha n=1 Tax=Nitriliruptor sp. TaxID=2448056 RepID=UPI00349FF755